MIVESNREEEKVIMSEVEVEVDDIHIQGGRGKCTLK